MKSLEVSSIVAVVLLVSATLTQAQEWSWAIKPIGQAGTAFNDNAVTGVAIDNFDNTFIVGQFNDSAVFSTIPMKSVNELDIYIAKLNSSGALDWVRTVGGPYSQDGAADVCVDPLGNAYMTGFFADSLDFGGGHIVRFNGISFNAFAKYDTDGNLLWAKNAVGASSDAKGGLVYSRTGHIYSGMGRTLAKYTLDGDSVWAVTFPFAANTIAIYDVAVDSAGQFVFITGAFSGETDFGSGYVLNNNKLGNLDIFLAKYDSDGNLAWAKQAGEQVGLWPEYGNSIQVDKIGDIYICGRFTETAGFDTDSISTGGSMWSMFVAKYDAAGDVIWVKGGSASDQIISSAAEIKLVADESALLLAGDFSFALNNPFTFDGIQYTMPVGGNDALMLMLDVADGSVIWSKQSGSGQAFITVNAMDLNPTDNSAVVVGMHKSMGAIFTPFSFANPPIGSADGFIVGLTTGFVTDVGDQDHAAIPDSYSLRQNYPNPFNPSTSIEYNLARRSYVRIEIINALGQSVRMLVDRVEAAGSHTAVWDGTSSNGEPVATGVYFYRLQADGVIETRRMLLLK